MRPEGADCRAVGERLASREMGNYASREEREPTVLGWQRACEGAKLTRKEGRCIVEAAGDDEIAACERPLVPELVGDPKGCARIGEHAKVVLSGATGRVRPIVNVIDEVPEAVKRLCVEGKWSAEVKQCLLAAASFGDAERCIGMMELGDRRAVERKLTSMVKMGGIKGPPKEDPWR